MDELSLKKIVFISLCVAVLSVFILSIIMESSSSLKEKYVLIIGIMSSPDNFEKRMSLRNTWLQLTSDISVAYYFIIGEHFCNIHPLDRVSDYSCERNLMSLPGTQGENYFITDTTAETEFTTLKRVPIRKPIYSSTLNSFGFGFHTLNDIIVKKLGVIKILMDYVKSDVKVTLVSSESKTILASVIIPHSQAKINDSDFVLIPINHIILKKKFEAQVVMESVVKNTSYLANCKDFEWNLIPGAINYVQLIQAEVRKPLPFKMNSCSFVVMNYRVADLRAFKAHLAVKEERKREWEKSQNDILLKLKNESNHFADIAFVDVVDVYRNLPQKLIKFFKRITHTEYFHSILKTDDDSFIDVPRVYRQVLAISNASDEGHGVNFGNRHWKSTSSHEHLLQFWWWSSFREFWKVQESGKWREDKYRSPAYPSFPCGGGYVLSRGLVNYLSENENNLQYFQGEDVSIGIWLSGLKTTQYTTPNIPGRDHPWIRKSIATNHEREESGSKIINSSQNNLVPDICDWTCDREQLYNIPLCNIVQLNPSEMYETWDRYLRYGFI